MRAINAPLWLLPLTEGETATWPPTEMWTNATCVEKPNKMTEESKKRVRPRLYMTLIFLLSTHNGQYFEFWILYIVCYLKTFISYCMFYSLHVVKPLRYDSVLIKETNEWMNEWVARVESTPFILRSRTPRGRSSVAILSVEIRPETDTRSEPEIDNPAEIQVSMSAVCEGGLSTTGPHARNR